MLTSPDTQLKPKFNRYGLKEGKVDLQKIMLTKSKSPQLKPKFNHYGLRKEKWTCKNSHAHKLTIIPIKTQIYY